MIHNRRGDVYIRGVLQVCNRLICRVCAQDSSLNVLLSLALQKNKRATLLKLDTSLSKIGSLEYSMFESISFEPNYLNTNSGANDCVNSFTVIKKNLRRYMLHTKPFLVAQWYA